jgi:hypothetical protein
MVGIFQDRFATAHPGVQFNVGFWWCPTEGGGLNNGTNGDAGRTQISKAYPGDAYVDWVGCDKYNHDRNDVFCTPPHAGWAEPDEMWNYFYSSNPFSGQTYPLYREFGMRKPFVVGETGCKYDTAGVPSGHVVDPNRKANWFKNIQYAKNRMNAFSGDAVNGLRGVMYFDQYVISESNDWHVDSNQPGGTGLPKGSFDAVTYQGFKDWARGLNQPNANTTPGRVDVNVGVAGGR